MPFKQVTIVGTGLIGGSLGLALKKRHLATRIIGCDRAPVLKRAKDCGAIETGATNISEAVRGSDLIVLATPVITIIDLIERLGPSLPARTLVTDVGSTKAEIAQRAAKSFGRAAAQRFLAGHPMAGKEMLELSLPTPIFFKERLGSLRRCHGKIRTPVFVENFSIAWRKSARTLPCSIPPNMIGFAHGSAICHR